MPSTSGPFCSSEYTMFVRNPAARRYYQTLELADFSSMDEVRRAYKALALRYHPDKNLSNVEEATTRFTEIRTAYDVLSKEDTKKTFDSALRQYLLMTGASSAYTPARGTYQSHRQGRERPSTAADKKARPASPGSATKRFTSKSSSQVPNGARAVFASMRKGGMGEASQSPFMRQSSGAKTSPGGQPFSTSAFGGTAAECSTSVPRSPEARGRSHGPASKTAPSEGRESQYTAEQQEMFRRKERERQMEYKRRKERERREQRERELEALKREQEKREEQLQKRWKENRDAPQARRRSPVPERAGHAGDGGAECDATAEGRPVTPPPSAEPTATRGTASDAGVAMPDVVRFAISPGNITRSAVAPISHVATGTGSTTAKSGAGGVPGTGERETLQARIQREKERQEAFRRQEKEKYLEKLLQQRRREEEQRLREQIQEEIGAIQREMTLLVSNEVSERTQLVEQEERMSWRRILEERRRVHDAFILSCRVRQLQVEEVEARGELEDDEDGMFSLLVLHFFEGAGRHQIMAQRSRRVARLLGDFDTERRRLRDRMEERAALVAAETAARRALLAALEPISRQLVLTECFEDAERLHIIGSERSKRRRLQQRLGDDEEQGLLRDALGTRRGVIERDERHARSLLYLHAEEEQERQLVEVMEREAARALLRRRAHDRHALIDSLLETEADRVRRALDAEIQALRQENRQLRLQLRASVVAYSHPHTPRGGSSLPVNSGGGINPTAAAAGPGGGGGDGSPLLASAELPRRHSSSFSDHQSPWRTPAPQDPLPTTSHTTTAIAAAAMGNSPLLAPQVSRGGVGGGVDDRGGGRSIFTSTMTSPRMASTGSSFHNLTIGVAPGLPPSDAERRSSNAASTVFPSRQQSPRGEGSSGSWQQPPPHQSVAAQAALSTLNRLTRVASDGPLSGFGVLPSEGVRSSLTSTSSPPRHSVSYRSNSLCTSVPVAQRASHSPPPLTGSPITRRMTPVAQCSTPTLGASATSSPLLPVMSASTPGATSARGLFSASRALLREREVAPLVGARPQPVAVGSPPVGGIHSASYRRNSAFGVVSPRTGAGMEGNCGDTAATSSSSTGSSHPRTMSGGEGWAGAEEGEEAVAIVVPTRRWSAGDNRLREGRSDGGLSCWRASATTVLHGGTIAVISAVDEPYPHRSRR